MQSGKTESQEEWDKRYPVHARLRETNHDRQTIGDFLVWLGEQGIELAQHPPEATHAWLESALLDGEFATTDQLLSKYFDIDRWAMEDEKQRMIEELREAQGLTE